MIIAFDVMGGDLGSRPCVLAAVKFVRLYQDTAIHLYGDREIIQRNLDEISSSKELKHLSATTHSEDLVIHHCETAVGPSDDAGFALRHKRDSSMAKALLSVGSSHASACVSGGNTGALLAFGRYFVKNLDGVKRPAMCRAIPTRTGLSYMLDLGANLVCSAENLYQFAIMGAALAKVSGIAEPKVAILNVGTEMSKGGSELKRAAQMLRAQTSGYDFIGFVEGDELFNGDVDVIVCDGFSGNVALKVSEGLVKHLVSSLNEFFNASAMARLCKLVFGFLIKSWSRKKNPSLYNGAAFLGLKKTLIKSHGSADELGILKALEAAREQALADIPGRIARHLSVGTVSAG